MEAEIEKELENQKWWRELGHYYDLELLGWTDRHYATFYAPEKPNKMIQIDAVLAKHMRDVMIEKEIVNA